MTVHDSHSSSQWSGLKDATFGSIAGMASKVFEHPFDLCKVRLQSQVLDESARFKGPIDCLYKTWKYEGIRGLYRGLPAPIVAAMCENATLFFVFNQLGTVVRSFDADQLEKSTLSQVAIAAAGAGAVTSFLLTPIELVKCKMQVQMLAAGVAPPLLLAGTPLVRQPPSFQTLPGPFSIVSSTIRSQGIRGLWLGHTGTLIRETGGSAAWFTTKEFVSSLFLSRRAKSQNPDKTSLQPWESAASGACAGVAYNIVLFPADSVKSTIQTEQEMRPGKPPSSFVQTFKAIYRAQGMRGLYAGCGITVARAAPSSAIIFLIYDSLAKRFG